MRFILEIKNLDNAAFGDGVDTEQRDAEIARILSVASRLVREYKGVPNTTEHTLRDDNGNKVGYFKLEKS